MMAGAAENYPGDAQPAPFGFDLGTVGEQQLFLKFPGPVPVDVATTLGGLAEQFQFTVRNVTPPLREQPHQTVETCWWEVEPDVLQNLDRPIREVVLDRRFSNHLGRTGVATLMHALCFGRRISDWDANLGFGEYAYERRGQLAGLIVEQSPFPWLDAPTVKDIARMCPTVGSVWAGCLAAAEGSAEAGTRSGRASRTRRIVPRDFTARDRWLSVGEIARDPNALPAFFASTNVGDELSNRLVYVDVYNERARAFQAAFEGAQQEFGIA